MAHEVAGMRRAELEVFEGRLAWSIPPERTKNGAPSFVPLAPLAAEVIHSLPRIGRSQLVFTTTGKAAISGWSKSKARLDRRMLELARAEAEERGRDPAEVTIADWRLHDLRRTAATAARPGLDRPPSHSATAPPCP